MPASVNNSVKVFATGGVTSLTSASWAIGGSNRYLVHFIGSGDGSPVAPSGSKWGGSGGTALSQKGTTLTVTGFGYFSAYQLTAPTAQTSTSYVSWPSSQSDALLVGIAVQDADQVTPTNTLATATGVGASPTVNATSVSGNLVLDGVYFLDTGANARTLTVGAGQTSLQEIEGANTNYEGLGSSTETATGTSTTMSWTISAAIDAWGIFAFAVNAASGGGGSSITPHEEYYKRRRAA